MFCEIIAGVSHNILYIWDVNEMFTGFMGNVVIIVCIKYTSIRFKERD